MENKFLLQLKMLILHELEKENVEVVLFGSRARKDNNKTSDVDVGILPHGVFDEKKLVFLKEKVEELNIPYKIELIDFREVSEDFKTLALKDAVVWKD